MAYEFKTLGSVEALAEVPENAHALVEVDGEIKRVPGGALGGSGGGGMKHFIAKVKWDYENDRRVTETNLSYEELREALSAEEPCIGVFFSDSSYRQCPIVEIFVDDEHIEFYTCNTSYGGYSCWRFYSDGNIESGDGPA